MNTKNQVIILSAELPRLDYYVNQDRTTLLRNMLIDIGLPFRSVRGFYKGTMEHSFLVVINDMTLFETVRDFAFKTFEQESILYQESSGLCSLIYNDETVQNLGKMHLVNEETAKMKDSYTQIDDKFYITA